jgi:hypothetical protein
VAHSALDVNKISSEPSWWLATVMDDLIEVMWGLNRAVWILCQEWLCSSETASQSFDWPCLPRFQGGLQPSLLPALLLFDDKLDISSLTYTITFAK